MEKTLTIPSIVTLTTLSPSSPPPPPPSPAIIWTPILIVVCCPNLTILVPARQSQQTNALSAPAETRFLEDSATARMPLRCPASCWSGVNVKEEYRWTRLEYLLVVSQHAEEGWWKWSYPTSWNPTTKTSISSENVSRKLETRFSGPTFISQKINATDRFLDLQTFLHFSSFDVPEPDGLIVGSTDQPFP